MTLERRDAPTVAMAGAEFRASPTTTNTQSAPAIAVDSDGDFVVVWESLQDGSGYGIYFHRYDKNGNSLGSGTGEFRANVVTTGDQRSPTVAMDDDGDFVIAWESYAQDGDSYGIYARKYDNTGTAVTTEFRVNTTTTDIQYRAAVAMDSTGDFVIAWQSYQEGAGAPGDGVYFQRYDSAAVAQGGETHANVTTTQFQGNPAVAMDSSGDFVIAWQSYTTDGDGYGIYARRYDAAGVPQTASEFRVNQTTANEQREPAVALDSSGDFVVAWEALGQDGSGYGIYARRYDSAGNATTGEFLVNVTTANDQRAPAVTLDSAGDLVVAWSSFGQEAGSYGIYARRYTPTNAADGSEFHVNTYTTAHQRVPAVASSALGNFVVAWQSEGQDLSGSGVYAQRFNAVFPPKVQSLTINDGNVQRSRVTYISVAFDSVVTYPSPNIAAAFTLAGPSGNIAMVGSTPDSTPTQTIIRLAFSGLGTTAGSLDDGNYTLTVHASQITAGPGGPQLDGNGDGTGGDSYTNNTIFRLFGDTDGNRTVNQADFNVFRNVFNEIIGSPNYLPYLDYNNDGFINQADFIAFRSRFNITIPAP